MSDARMSWLLIEGLLPLAGAGILYLLWGGFRYVSTEDKAAFTYHWWGAADPLGWLYGAVIIAVQSAQDCLAVSGSHVLAWMCAIGGFACLLLLVAAMTDRGASATWKPPVSLQVFAAVLVCAILYAGYRVQGLTPTGVAQ